MAVSINDGECIGDGTSFTSSSVGRWQEVAAQRPGDAASAKARPKSEKRGWPLKRLRGGQDVITVQTGILQAGSEFEN
jgi:hypothetical protein